MKNLGQMMKQAQEMQQRMQEMQESLADETAEGSAGGGMVTVTLNGKGVMTKVSIDPELSTPEEREVLEDLIVAAHNDAKTKIEDVIQEKMAEVTGGLNLPGGMQLPF